MPLKRRRHQEKKKRRQQQRQKQQQQQPPLPETKQDVATPIYQQELMEWIVSFLGPRDTALIAPCSKWHHQLVKTSPHVNAGWSWDLYGLWPERLDPQRIATNCLAPPERLAGLLNAFGRCQSVDMDWGQTDDLRALFTQSLHHLRMRLIPMKFARILPTLKTRESSQTVSLTSLDLVLDENTNPKTATVIRSLTFPHLQRLRYEGPAGSCLEELLRRAPKLVALELPRLTPLPIESLKGVRQQLQELEVFGEAKYVESWSKLELPALRLFRVVEGFVHQIYFPTMPVSSGGLEQLEIRLECQTLSQDPFQLGCNRAPLRVKKLVLHTSRTSWSHFALPDLREWVDLVDDEEEVVAVVTEAHGVAEQEVRQALAALNEAESLILGAHEQREQKRATAQRTGAIAALGTAVATKLGGIESLVCSGDALELAWTKLLGPQLQRIEYVVSEQVLRDIQQAAPRREVPGIVGAGLMRFPLFRGVDVVSSMSMEETYHHIRAFNQEQLEEDSKGVQVETHPPPEQKSVVFRREGKSWVVEDTTAHYLNLFLTCFSRSAPVVDRAEVLRVSSDDMRLELPVERLVLHGRWRKYSLLARRPCQWVKMVSAPESMVPWEPELQQAFPRAKMEWVRHSK